MKKYLKIVLIAMLSFTFAFAQKGVLKIGSGGKSGNYFQVANDIINYCGNEIKNKYGYSLANISTSGSVDNIERIKNKKLSLAFVQSDVLEYFNKRDTLQTLENSTFKLINLYPEYLHILIPKGWQPKKTNSGWFSNLKNLFSDNSNKTISIYSLKNQVVYAKGGAIVSAQALSYFLNLNLHIVNADNGKVNGPFIFVTGSGDKRIQKMLASGKWWLLSFNPVDLTNRVSFYKPAKLTYIINGKSTSVNTVSIMSVVIARKYNSKKRIAAINEIKQCIHNNIDDLLDDDDTSPKWQLIKITNGW